MSRVMVAMSGGVDSSVAAALISEAGHEVVGVTLKLWGSAGEFAEAGCCTASDAADARRVASQLGIDYYVFDFVEPFEKSVVDPFVDAYMQGLTPNPCIECNRSIKFSLLFDRATQLGCDLLATGHHARIRRSFGQSAMDLNSEDYPWGETSSDSAIGYHNHLLETKPTQTPGNDLQEMKSTSVKHRLLRGKDRVKDQSYVLYMLDQKMLSRLLFPIGELTKTEVREIAASLGLRTASKPESQDICFVGSKGVDRFVTERVGKSNNLRLEDDLGNHLGTAARSAITIGQRRGLGAHSGSRLYVKEIWPQEGLAVLAPKEDLYRQSIIATDFNWVSGTPPSSLLSGEVQIRYNSKPTRAKLSILDSSRVKIEFDEPVWAPTPGQFAVVYDGEEVLGGGVIVPDNRGAI